MQRTTEFVFVLVVLKVQTEHRRVLAGFTRGNTTNRTAAGLIDQRSGLIDQLRLGLWRNNIKRFFDFYLLLWFVQPGEDTFWRRKAPWGGGAGQTDPG